MPDPDRPHDTVGDEGRDPGVTCDERHLADDVPRGTPGDLALAPIEIRHDADHPIGHHVELVPELPLACDRLPVGVPSLLSDLGDPLEVGRRQLGEERDLPQDQRALDHRDRGGGR